MSSPTCLNCEENLEVSAKFCPQCGQKTSTHRLTMAHILHDSFHAVTHADKGIFHLLKDLAVKPGIVAREYIAGKRKKYFNPFTFFLIIMGLFVVSASYFNSSEKAPQPDSAVLARMPEQYRTQYIVMSGRATEAGNFMKKHGNIVAMCAVPFFALLSWAIFRRNGYNYAEHLTANLLFITFSNLVFTLLIYPLMGLSGNRSSGNFIFVFWGLFLQTVYFTWCYYQFQPALSKYKLLKAFSLSLAGVVLWFVISLIPMSIYIYRSWDFYKMLFRMFR